MIPWWLAIAAAGLFLGGATAATSEGVRLYAKTIGAPLALRLLYVCLPERMHGESTFLRAFLEYVTLIAFAFAGDYIVGRKLGKNDAKGYREER